MRYKFLALMTALSMLLALTACTGGSGSSAKSDVSSAEPEAFGAENIGGQPEQMAETTGEPEDGAMESQNEPGAVTETGEESVFGSLDDRAVLSALIVVYQDKIPYSAEDPVFFWRAVARLVACSGEPIEDGHVRISAEELAPYVAALFAGYEGPYPMVGEENPYVAEEYVDGETVYVITSTGPPDYAVNLTEQETDGSGTWGAELTGTGTDGSIISYSVSRTDYDGPAQEKFAYSITGIAEEE